MGLKLADSDTTPSGGAKTVGMYKLTNGTDIIGEVVGNSNTEVQLKNPMMLVIAKNTTGGFGLQFVPFAIGADEDHPVRIFRAHIVSELIPESNLVTTYFGLFSNLVTPPQDEKILLPGELRLSN